MKKLLLKSVALAALCAPVAMQAQNSINLRGTTYSVDTLYHAKVGPGTTQTHLELMNSYGTTLQVFYLTVDKTTPGVSMRAVCATDKVAGNERPSTMAKRKSGNGVLYFAGTNGDFYSTSGTATNGSSKVGSPTTGCTVDRETYKTSNGNYQFSVDTAGVARVSRLYYYTGTAKLGDKSTLFKGINVASPNNGITIYTPKYWGSTNQTDKAGNCAEVTAKLVEGDKMYAGCKFRLEVTSTSNDTGDTTIPSDGYVIHGRGTSTSGDVNTGSLAFVQSLQVGDIIEFENIVLLQQGSTERIVPAQIVSGNPKNVGGGETLDTESERGDASDLHPRTGIGVSQSGDSIIMMVVDGRSTISAGVRTSQLADIMRYAGAYEAVNLDGGGSSCLYTSALGVRNNGSDGSERAVGNGIFATITAPEDNEITEIQFVDWVKELPQYGYYTPKFYGYNKYGVMVDSNLKGVTLSCGENLGVIVNDGTTLYANGGGCHTLEATYNGVKTNLVVTVDDKTEPIFRHSKVLLDTYHDYKVDIYGTVRGNDISIENREFTWSVEDETIATVDENGVVKGLKNGTTVVKGTLGDKTREIAVTVEIPPKRYKGIDENLDPSTWTLESSNIENFTVAPLGVEGMEINYTTKSTRKVEASMSKDITTWSRPDSLCIDINPGNAQIKNISLYLLKEGETEPWECVLEPTLKANELNRIEMRMDTFVNVNDMGAYPIKLTKIRIVPKGSTGTANLQIPRFSWVYNAVPADASGVESVVAENNTLVLTPNPVNAGAVVRLGVAEPVKYTVRALNGAVVAEGEGVEIATATMSTGVYIVKVGDKQGKLIVK
jgi:hypothetical protein